MARTFGEISGIANGSTFPDRRSLHDSGIHRPLQHGISGSAAEGADSIVVSGGYEDDVDHGDEIIYTGAGGNDPSSKRQIADQMLKNQNLALAISGRRGLPVRVIRGRGGNPAYAPARGFRYDGLFEVVGSWEEVGRSGYKVIRYRLVKLRG